jgi:uncharacterized protein
MSSHLPKYITPRRFCEDGLTLSGELSISQFKRLEGLLFDGEGKVVISLVFGKDDQRLPCIEGSLQVDWHLVCQRCGGKLTNFESISFLLSPVSDEKYIQRLPEAYDPLMVEDDKILLAAVVEDELLLAMPIAPKHEAEYCVQILKNFNDNQVS